jgi:hypothetical protein
MNADSRALQRLSSREETLEGGRRNFFGILGAGISCSLPLGMLQARNGAFLSKQQKKQRKKSPLMLQRTYPRNPVNPIHPDETPSR